MKWFKLFIFCFLITLSQKAFADHLVGGEFRITHLGNNSYDIELFVYGDSKGLTDGNEDSGINATIFSKQNPNISIPIRLPLYTTSSVAYINSKCQTGSISTKILHYKTTYNFTGITMNSPSGYYIVWERCCRNMSIVNIQQPGATGMVFYAEFPAPIKNLQPFINSTPALPPMPPDYLCAGQLYQYSMKSTDPDGDRLVYSLSEPLKGNSGQGTGQGSGKVTVVPAMPAPYAKVFWQPGYGLSQMIPGSPSLNIDPVTGLLSVRPLNAGLFVFGVTVEEYRFGQKIGEVRRDMQVKVNGCQVNTSPAVSVRPPGATADYVEGDILTVTDATDYCFAVSFSDPDLNQTISVKAVPVNFNSAITLIPSSGTITTPGQKFTTNICWPDCKINSPNQLFLVDLIVTDDACGNSLSQTLRLTFRVIPKPNQKPKIRLEGVKSPVKVNVGERLRFNIIGTDSIDNDLITVSMEGKGIDTNQPGITLTPASGLGKVTSEFNWIPDCSYLTGNASYRIKFRVKDNSCYAGNLDTTSVRIQVEELKETVEFLPPNLFTPNNDSFNDFFEMPNLPTEKCAEKFEGISIFNRWGVKVFSAKDRDFAWDGKNVIDGVYYYTLRHGPRQYKGTVTIVR